MKNDGKDSSTTHERPPKCQRGFGARVSAEALIAVSLSAALLGSPAPCFAGQPPAYATRGEPIGAVPSTNSAPALPSPSASGARAGAAQTNAVAAPPKAAATGKSEDFEVAGFDKLSRFNFEGSDSPVSPADAAEASRKFMAQIPPAIKALNEKPVAVRGFMLPMKVEHGMVTEFLLLKNQMGCCFGVNPAIN